MRFALIPEGASVVSFKQFYRMVTGM